MTTTRKPTTLEEPGVAETELTALQQPRILLRRRVASLAPFADPWRLLNAGSPELRTALEELYDSDDISALGSLLQALRTQFKLRAKQERREALLSTIMVDLRVLGIEADHRELLRRMIAVHTPELAGQQPPGDHTPPLLVAHLAPPLFTLLWLLQEASPSNVYCCEQCSWIGHSRRTDKRFCGNVCRLRWERNEREIRVEASASLSGRRRAKPSAAGPREDDPEESEAQFPEDSYE